MVFKNCCIIVLWVRVALALEGLSEYGDICDSEENEARQVMLVAQRTRREG